MESFTSARHRLGAITIYVIVFGTVYLELRAGTSAIGPCLSAAGLIGVASMLGYLNWNRNSAPDWFVTLGFACIIAPLPGFLPIAEWLAVGLAFVTSAILVAVSRVVKSDHNC